MNDAGDGINQSYLNSLPDGEILGWSKLKDIVQDNFRFVTATEGQDKTGRLRMDDDWLTDDEELDGPTYKAEQKVITRSHYIENYTRDRCSNKDCTVSFLFPSVRRRHHCRRCGEVFCRDCLQYRRKLNLMAQPDAKGISYRVCFACYIEREIILEGVRRSRTKECLSMRSDHLEERRKLVCDVTLEIRRANIMPTFWKEQFEVDIPKECQRLLEGFEDEVGSSETMKTIERTTKSSQNALLAEVHILGIRRLHYCQGRQISNTLRLKHRSNLFCLQLEKTTTSCRECRVNVAGLRKKRNCRVCGLALCKKCAHKTLFYRKSFGETLRQKKKLLIITVRLKHNLFCQQLEKTTMSCRECRANVAGLRKRRNCRVCGLALCKKCAHKELLLYYKDGYQDTAIPRLAIIRIEGSPEVEPRYSLLLYICEECRNFIRDKQILDPDWFIKKPKPPDVMSQLQAIDGIFRDLNKEIDDKMSELEETSKSDQAGDRRRNSRNSVYGLVLSIHDIDSKREFESNKQTIVDEINQKLCRYFSLYTKLRTLRHENKDHLGYSFSKLLNNYIKRPVYVY